MIEAIQSASPPPEIAALFAEALERAIPEPGMTVTRCAERYRMLSPERCAMAEEAGEPIPWDTGVVPYTREIMDCASNPAVRGIVVVKGNQLTISTCVSNMILYFAHTEPTTQLYACEDQSKAEAFSKEEVASMIRDSPALRGLVKETRERDSDNTILAKRYPRGHLAFGWSTSPKTASSRPRRVIYLDERDAYAPTKEGDYCSLAARRADTYKNKLIVKLSTPRNRLENPPGTALDAPRYSPIEREYQETDRRKFWVPCLHCETFQTLKWSQIQWPKDDPLAAYYVCESCGAVLEEDDKAEMLARGKWIAEAEFRGVAGFFINRFYSPFVTWGECAEEFLLAKRSGDPEQLKVWVNTCLAEGWQDPEERIHTTSLEERREDYGGDGPIPIGVCLITAGCDVQGADRVEGEILGHGLNGETWSLDYPIIFGDAARPSTWEKVKERIVNREFVRADGVRLRVSCTTVDSGDGGYANEVYEFAFANRGYRVFAIKGSSTPGRRLVTKPSMVGKPPRQVKLFLLGTEAAKDTFIANLRVEEEGPGYCHFPLERPAEQGRTIYSEDHFKMLLAETPRLVKGVRVWKKVREAQPNEALDCRVYAMAAKDIINPDMKKIHRALLYRASRIAEAAIEADPDAGGEGSDPPPAPPATSKPKPPRRPSFQIPRRRGGGFIKGF